MLYTQKNMNIRIFRLHQKLKDQLASIHISNGNFYDIDKVNEFMSRMNDAIEIKKYLDGNIEELLK